MPPKLAAITVPGTKKTDEIKQRQTGGCDIQLETVRRQLETVSIRQHHPPPKAVGTPRGTPTRIRTPAGVAHTLVEMNQADKSSKQTKQAAGPRKSPSTPTSRAPSTKTRAATATSRTTDTATSGSFRNDRANRVAVNDLINSILNKSIDYDQDNEKIKWERFNSGSAYEHLEVSDSDYDVMMIATIPCDPDIHDTSPSTCNSLRVRNSKYVPSEILRGGQYLEPNQFSDYFYKRLKESRELKGVSINAREPSSPAIKIKIKRYSSPVEVDIVPAVCCGRKDSYLEKGKQLGFKWPKWIKGSTTLEKLKGDGLCFVAKDDGWRISFSKIEKEMMVHADTTNGDTASKTCRKEVLKWLKAEFQTIRGSDKTQVEVFSSYCIKCHMFEMFDKWSLDEYWLPSNKKERQLTAITDLIEKFKKRDISLYFIPSINLLQDITKKEATFLVRQFTEAKKNI